MHMTETMFALLPLNGLQAERWRERGDEGGEMEERRRGGFLAEDLSLNTGATDPPRAFKTPIDVDSRRVWRPRPP